MNNQQPIEMPQLNFQELPQPPTLDQDLLTKIDNLIKSKNWIESHQCITMVRQINKFFPQYIPDVVERYGSALVDHFNHGKTQIYKNILRLIKQVFDMGRQVNVEKAVYPFLPLLLKKSVTEIGHIKEMSQLVLTSFSQNCGYQVSFAISAEYCIDKNAQIAELAIKLLTRLTQNVGSSIMNVNPETLKLLMYSLMNLVNGKRKNLKNYALDIWSQNYVSLMNFSLSPQDVQIMSQAMENHRTQQKPKHIPLADVLKQRKMEKQYNQNFGNSNFNNSNCNYNYGNSNNNYY